MTDAQTFSWILLSIGFGGSTRRQISEVADGIMHAVPTDREMETSLQWLQNHELVQEDGGRFALTPMGSTLLAGINDRSGTIMETWHALAVVIQEMLPGDHLA